MSRMSVGDPHGSAPLAKDIRLHDLSDVGSVEIARIAQSEATSQQTKKFLSSVFSGNASLLINSLVDSGEITVREMEELVQMLRKEGK